MQKLLFVETPKIGFAPPRYACIRTDEPIAVDGSLDEPAWATASWTRDFTGIEGDECERPGHRTRAKLLWDNRNLYVGAEMTWRKAGAEPQASLLSDAEFTILFNPSNTTHEYGEIVVNARAEVDTQFWAMPHRDGGAPIKCFSIKGLAVRCDARGDGETARWSLEAAIPWASVFGDGERSKPPKAGGFWRINLSRADWRVETDQGERSKVINPYTRMPRHDGHWAWAPTGAATAHYPELWGYVFFTDAPRDIPLPPDEPTLWQLRLLYFRQRAYRARNGRFADALSSIGERQDDASGLLMEVTRDMFQITLPAPSGALYAIRQDGYVWRVDEG